MSDYIEIAGNKYPVKISYKMALLELPKHDINLLSLFEGENLTKLLEKIQVSNEDLLKLLNLIVFDNKKSIEQLADLLDKSDENMLEDFREKLWTAVVNFTPARLREPLKQALTEVLHQMESQMETNIQNMVQSDQNQNS